MADDPNVTVDTTEAQASASKLAKEYLALSRVLDDLVDRLARLEKAGQGSGTEARNLRLEIERTRNSMSDLEKNVDSTTIALARQARASMEAVRIQSELRKEFSGTALSGSGLDRSLSQLTTTLLGVGASATLLGTKTGTALLQPFSDAQQVIGGIHPKVAQLNEVFRKNAEAQDLVNVGYLALGKSMGDIKGRGDLVIDAVQKTAAQFFFTGQEQQKFIENTRTIPGVLDAVTTAAAGAGKNMTQMAQYMLVARGAGLTTAEGAKVLDTAYKQFGTVGMPKVAEELAKFASAAKDTGVPIGIVQEKIVAASGPLAIFGNKMTEATSVWKTFTQSLKDVPVDEVGRLTQQVTSNIATMSLGTQAFVAQMSGMVHGVTALGGALRMELAMREPGGMERNLERVMQTISRMGGGRIINLQEAAQTPALEMQFQLQRQMVGQMLGVQGGQQQSRILEVLQSMEKGGASGTEASKNIQELMADGQKAQTASTTAMEQTAMGIGRTNSFLREIVGIEQAAGRELRGIGRALGAAGVGARPREADVARAGLAAARAGRAVATTAPRAAERMGALATTIGVGARRGMRAFEGERRRRAELAPTGEPIDVMDPRTEAERLRVAPFAPGAGAARGGRAAQAPFAEEAERLGLAPFAAIPEMGAAGPPPLFRRQDRRAQMAGATLPLFERREMEMPPPAPEGGRAPGRPAAGRAAGRAAETEAGGGMGAPLEPATIRISVVCEKCLEKKVYDISRKAVSGARGDDHTHE